MLPISGNRDVKGSKELTVGFEKNAVKKTTTLASELALTANPVVVPLLQRQLTQIGILEKQMLASSRYLRQQRFSFRGEMGRT